MDVSSLSIDQNHLSLVYNCCFGNQPEWIIMFKQLAASNKKLRVKDNTVSGKVLFQKPLFPNLKAQIKYRDASLIKPASPRRSLLFFNFFRLGHSNPNSDPESFPIIWHWMLILNINKTWWSLLLSNLLSQRWCIIDKGILFFLEKKYWKLENKENISKNTPFPRKIACKKRTNTTSLSTKTCLELLKANGLKEWILGIPSNKSEMVSEIVFLKELSPFFKAPMCRFNGKSPCRFVDMKDESNGICRLLKWVDGHQHKLVNRLMNIIRGTSWAVVQNPMVAI